MRRRHLALGTAGLGQEDANMHLMNLVWPNCFEQSPHVIGATSESLIRVTPVIRMLTMLVRSGRH